MAGRLYKFFFSYLTLFLHFFLHLLLNYKSSSFLSLPLSILPLINIVLFGSYKSSSFCHPFSTPSFYLLLASFHFSILSFFYIFVSICFLQVFLFLSYPSSIASSFRLLLPCFHLFIILLPINFFSTFICLFPLLFFYLCLVFNYAIFISSCFPFLYLLYFHLNKYLLI